MPIRAAAALVLLVLLLLVGVPSPAASGAADAPTPALPGPLWLVKSNDLALLQHQATADGATLPAFATWVGCGGKSDPDRCRPGQQPIFTSYVSLRRLALSGWHGTAVFDIEPCSYTPRAERRNPVKFICLASRLQKTDPFLRVIIAPFRKPTKKIILEDVAAARCRASAVDVQSQFANGFPAKFGQFITRMCSSHRTWSRTTTRPCGLAYKGSG